MTNFYETELFVVETIEKPHVCRTDGGHIVIKPKREVSNRWDLTPIEAKELTKLSMIIGKAMKRAMKARKVNIERINFQDNGNWAIGTKRKALFHLHLYGRSKHELFQTRGEALYFPPKETHFFDKLKPLNKTDIKEIIKEIKKISKEKKYQISNW